LIIIKDFPTIVNNQDYILLVEIIYNWFYDVFW
jgi:hypothetical protein